MRILKFDSYRDGGTMIYSTDEGDVFQDFRIGTKEAGTLWRGYPEDVGSSKLSKEDVVKFWEAIQQFNYINTSNYDKSIKGLRSVYEAPKKKISTMDTICLCGKSIWKMSPELPADVIQCASCTRKWPKYITLRETL